MAKHSSLPPWQGCGVSSPRGCLQPPVGPAGCMAISQPIGPDPAPAHPSQPSGAVVPYVSCDGFQTLLCFCSHRRAGDASPVGLPPCYGEHGGCTTSSRRSDNIPWVHGVLEERTEELERNKWGRRQGRLHRVYWAGAGGGRSQPVPRGGDEVGTMPAMPGWAGDRGWGVMASSGLSAWGPAGSPVPCWAL